MELHLIDWLRLFNAVLGITSLCISSLMWKNWVSLPSGEVMRAKSHLLLIAVAVYISIERIVHEDTAGFGTPLFTIALIYALRVAVVDYKEYQSPSERKARRKQ